MSARPSVQVAHERQTIRVGLAGLRLFDASDASLRAWFIAEQLEQLHRLRALLARALP